MLKIKRNKNYIVYLYGKQKSCVNSILRIAFLASVLDKKNSCKIVYQAEGVSKE